MKAKAVFTVGVKDNPKGVSLTSSRGSGAAVSVCRGLTGGARRGMGGDDGRVAMSPIDWLALRDEERGK